MKRTPLNRKTPLKSNKPLNQRSKTNKHRHTNVSVTDDTPCEVCQWLNGNNTGLINKAVTKHEVFHNNSAYMRNMSIHYGASIPICHEHHRQAHANNHGLDKRLKERYQRLLMDKNNWTLEEFINIFYKNHLGAL